MLYRVHRYTPEPFLGFFYFGFRQMILPLLLLLLLCGVWHTVCVYFTKCTMAQHQTVEMNANASKRIKAFHMASKQAVNVLNATATYLMNVSRHQFIALVQQKCSTFFVVVVFVSFLPANLFACHTPYSIAGTPLFVLSIAS